MQKGKLRIAQRGLLTFWCPGCNEPHAVTVALNGWTFNGDYDRPTFSPSVLVTSGHFIDGYNGQSCWCTFNAARPDNPSGFKCYRCHSFVTDGRIRFLTDSTHDLAGKTVELPDLPAHMTDGAA